MCSFFALDKPGKMRLYDRARMRAILCVRELDTDARPAITL